MSDVLMNTPYCYLDQKVAANLFSYLQVLILLELFVGILLFLELKQIGFLMKLQLISD